MFLEPENFLRPLFTGQSDHVVGEILEDVKIPVFISLRKVSPCDMAIDAGDGCTWSGAH